MITAIILMAGSGTRMKMNEMKCFLKLKDKMVFEYSLNTFYPLVDEIILVIRKEDEILIGRIYTVINKIAEDNGFKENGYRVIVNCGKDGGQEVMHLHYHILAGEKMGDKIV